MTTLAEPITLERADQIFLGGAVYTLRARIPFRQSDVAALLGVNTSVVSLWESDQRPVPHRRLSDLAWALGVEEQSLLQQGRIVRVGPPPPPPPEPPSFFPLLWCDSTHGATNYCPWPRKRHHHGPAPAWWHP